MYQRGPPGPEQTLSPDLEKAMHVRRFAIATLFASISLAAVAAQAQYIDHRASTPIQGILQGEADVIRSHGIYNKLTAEAANIGQEAYTKALDNDIKRVENYYKKKEIHDYAVKKLRKPPLSPEALARINKQRAPKRLGREQIDLAGKLYWPPTLEMAEFAPLRNALDVLFAERAQGQAGLGTSNYRQIREVAGQMKEQLQSYVLELGSTEYMQASKFIDRMKYEASFAMEADGLAAK